jgi:hypothetical protein
MRLVVFFSILAAALFGDSLHAHSPRRCCVRVIRCCVGSQQAGEHSGRHRLFLADANNMPQTRVFLLGVDGEIRKPDANGIVILPDQWVGTTVSVRLEGDNRVLASYRVEGGSENGVPRLEVKIASASPAQPPQLDQDTPSRLNRIRENNQKSQANLNETRAKLRLPGPVQLSREAAPAGPSAPEQL